MLPPGCGTPPPTAPYSSRQPNVHVAIAGNHDGTTTVKTSSRRSVLAGVTVFAAAAPLRGVKAAPYPERTITLVVPFSPGGSTDILARIVSKHLQRSLARIMHYAALFCTSGELTRADVPSGEIGVRQLVMQRVRG